jgi:hypothetical protein
MRELFSFAKALPDGENNMLLTELHTAEIPDLYARFASVVGDKHWKQRVASIKQEI